MHLGNGYDAFQARTLEVQIFWLLGRSAAKPSAAKQDSQNQTNKKEQE